MKGPYPSRRDVLAGTLATLGATILSASPARAAVPPIPYGAAVQPALLDSDPPYRDDVLSHCQMVVPEGSLKWAAIRPTRDVFRFDEADAYLRFAAQHGLLARGHTLVWGEANPDWLNAITAAEAEGVLVDHITRVVGHTAGRIESWDVVNEPMAAGPQAAGALRPSVWLDRLGPRYLDIAFRAAAAADPAARRVLNEYDIEFATPESRAKRAGVLALVRRLVDGGVPIQAVGIQGHIHGERRIDREGLSAFVSAIAAMGLDVYVTELDVIDDKLPAEVAVRDGIVAAQAEAFLGAIAAAARPRAVLTWGITDRHTWVPTWFKRADRLPNRPLPLDADDRPKPLMAVLRRACA